MEALERMVNDRETMMDATKLICAYCFRNFEYTCGKCLITKMEADIVDKEHVCRQLPTTEVVGL